MRSLVNRIGKRNLRIMLLLAALVFGVLFNIRALTDQSIRLDESQSIWFTTRPTLEVIRTAAMDVHMPLYYMVLHFWLQIFSPSIFAARMLSLVFFALSLPVYYLLVKESSNYKVAFLSLTMFLLSPFVVWFSTEARMYSLFIFITTVQNLFFLRFIRSKGTNSKLAYVISTIFGIYTHYFFNFVVITQFVYVVWTEISKMTTLKKITPFFRKYILLTMLAYLPAVPWFLYFISSGAGSLTSPMITTPTSFNIMQTFVSFLFGYQPNDIQAILISLWPLSLVFMFLVFTQRKRFSAGDTLYFFLMLLLPIALGFVVSFVRPIFLTRYFIFVTPSLFFLLGWVMINTTGKIFSIVTVPIILTMFGFMMFHTFSPNVPIKENYKEVTEYLQENANPQDIIAVTAPFTIYPIEYNYMGDARITTIPIWDRYELGPIPEYTDDSLRQMMDQYDDVYERIFVVFSYDQGYEENIRNVLDNSYHTLESHEFSTDLYVRVYQLRYE